MNDRPHYPWNQGDELFAEELNAAIANSGAYGPFVPIHANSLANVMDFGADPTGVADSTAAFRAALATGRSVWAPRGSYLIRDQLTSSNGQELFGDGRGLTTLLVDQTFSVTATGVISLTGREQLAPCVRDLAIQFAQPQDQSSRTNFKTLAAGGTSGTGGTGIQYPPAIIITSANRFRLYRLRISRAWNGVQNASGNTIGGFFIEDIEMSALNVGLSLDRSFDFGHIKTWHHWDFDLSSSLQLVSGDGATFAARFGGTGEIDGLDLLDFCSWHGRISITNANTWMAFHGLHMDGDNSTLEVSNSLWLQFSNSYFTGKPGGANTQAAQINVSGGNVLMANTVAFAGPSPTINVTGGALRMSGGELVESYRNASAVTQSGGSLELRNISFAANTGSGSWTVPLVNVTGGTIFFQSNRFASGSVGDVGGLVIVNDNTQHCVTDNFWNGWGFTPPGLLGGYGFNLGTIYRPAYMLNGATVGSPTAAGATLYMQAAAAAQRSMAYYSGSSLRWSVNVTSTPEGGSNAGSDFNVTRYTDAGAVVDMPISIARSSGTVNVPRLYANGVFGLNAGPVGRQTVTGAKGGNTALASLLTALAAFGLITDNTTA